MRESMGQRLEQLRAEKKLTKTELALLVNRTRTSITRYEEDAIPVPSDVLALMADTFDVSIDYLVFGDSDKGAGRLMSYYRKLPLEDRKEILEIAHLKLRKVNEKK